MTLGIVGGCFDPVHNGHIALARAALESGRVDEALLLPSGVPPHKRRAFASPADRLAMAELAARDVPGLSVCREEIDRPGVSYAADTVERLHARWPERRLVYVLGADALFRLGSWRGFERLVPLCAFLVMARPGGDDLAARREADALSALGAEIGFLPPGREEASSTVVRERVRLGLPLAGLVPPAVEAYIAARGLYR